MDGTLTTVMTDDQLEAVQQTLHDHLGPDWTQDYIEGSNGEPDYYRVATNTGNVIATVPDWAGSIALFLVEAHDYVPKLLAEITRLRATQPTTPDVAAITTAIKAFPFWNYGLDDVKPNSRDAEWVPDLAAAIQKALSGEAAS